MGDNTILECVQGIVLEEIKRADFYDNFIQSSLANSIGYLSGAAASFIDEVTIQQTDEEAVFIDVNRQPFKFFGMNREAEYAGYTITIDNNIVTSPGTSTLASRGIVFTNNIILEGGILLASAENTTISDNTINTTTANAIRIDSGCSYIDIFNNILTTGMSCIFENNTDSINILIEENICN